MKPEFDPQFKLEEHGDNVHISFLLDGLDEITTETVTTERLGKAKLPKAAYEQPDGQPIVFNKDYFDVRRGSKPTPGPFERAGDGGNVIMFGK